MVKRNDKQMVFSRRAVVLGALQGAGLSALLGRLYYLQFIKSEEYRTLSENNRIKLQLLAPERGHILDRNGLPLAENEKNYLLFLDSTGLKRSEVVRLVEATRRYLPLSDRRVQQVIDEMRANPYSSMLLVKEHLSWEEVAAIELHQLELPALSIEIGQFRHYPLGEHSAHLIGYVGAVAEEELEAADNEPLLRLPEYKIGKSACEKMLENKLRGTPGLKQLEVNVHGQVVRELSTHASVPGHPVRLTIDRRLQDYGSMRLKEESAAAIVMDVTNGDVLAFVSMPGFDPNIFSKGIPEEYWKELHDNIRDPLVNKATQGQYPPGSTFKMLVGLAGLKSGSINANTRVHCPGHFFLGDHRFNCWKEGGHGTMSPVTAIAQSCDTFFYTTAQRTGIDEIAAMAKLLGMGATHMGEYPAEKAGLVPEAEWKMKRYKQRWTTGDTVNAGIGQGYVLSTPMQLAVMAARLATGRAVSPRLLVPAGDEPAPEFAPLDINEEHLALIHEGMDMVANNASGTAYGKRIPEARFAMAGKTGTSQVRKIEKRGMKQELLPWEFRHHALFVGYAPVGAPKYAVAVAVEHGGGGAAAAAPVARDLLWKMQRLAEGNEEDPPAPPPPPVA